MSLTRSGYYFRLDEAKFQPIRSSTQIYLVHVVSTEFLGSFLKRHFAGKPPVASRIIACFLTLHILKFCLLTVGRPTSNGVTCGSLLIVYVHGRDKRNSNFLKFLRLGYQWLHRPLKKATKVYEREMGVIGPYLKQIPLKNALASYMSSGK